MITKTLSFKILQQSLIRLKIQHHNEFSCLNQFYTNQIDSFRLNGSKFNFSKTKQAKTQEHFFDQKSNYYQILGIQTSSSQQQIKVAYLNMVKKHHPDLSKQQNASQKFQLIQKAYQILSNPQKRAEYRATLDIPNPQTYQKAELIKQKYSKFSRKKNVPDEWQFSYKLYKKHYQQVDAKQKQYQKFVGQGDPYYMHKSQLKVQKKTYVQQASMIAGSITIALSTMYYMWGMKLQ